MAIKKISNIFIAQAIYIKQRWTKVENILDKVDNKIIDKFEKSIKELLSIYLINSANKQGLIDDKMKEHIIYNL